MNSSVEYRDIGVFSEESRSNDERVLLHTCPYCHQDCEIRNMEFPLSLHEDHYPQLYTCDECDKVYRLLVPDAQLSGVSTDDVDGESYVYREEYFEDTFEELLSQKEQRYEQAMAETQSYWQLLGRSSILPRFSEDGPGEDMERAVAGLFVVLLIAFITGINQKPAITMFATLVFVLASVLLWYGWSTLISRDEKHAGAYISGHAESGSRTMKLYIRLLGIAGR